MNTIFGLLSAFFWSVAYVLLARAGVRQRTFGMPVAAFATNISWEFIFSFTGSDVPLHRAVYGLWFFLDCGVGYTIVRYGPREFPGMSKAQFYVGFAGLLALAYPGLEFFSRHFDAGHGTYLAFLTNLLMSGFFVSMLVTRGSARGQSAPIAVSKMLGTVFASLVELTTPDPSPRYGGALLPYLYIACFVLDLLYVCLVIKAKRDEGSAAAVAAFAGS